MPPIKSKRIIATPFSSRNLRVLEKTNITIRDLIKGSNIKKKQIVLKSFEDKSGSPRPPRVRPGAIE